MVEIFGTKILDNVELDLPAGIIRNLQTTILEKEMSYEGPVILPDKVESPPIV